MEAMSGSQTRIHRAALRLFAEHGATQVTISELAQVAGVARGTIYNNLPNPETLFQDVAAQLGDEMNQRVMLSFQEMGDPAQRLARGIRQYIRRAHEEPDWGRFICRFAFSSASLRSLLTGAPAADIVKGIQDGRYTLKEEQMLSAIGLVGGSVLSAIMLVAEGHKTWRDAGHDTAELVLRALGIPAEEAGKIARAELPPLPELR